MDKPSIGFVGIGRMGYNMALRLNDCGYPIGAVYDLNKEVAKKLAAETGAIAATSLQEVNERSEIIFTVVSDDEAMKKLFFDEADSLLMNAQGKTYINCATTSPQVHIDIQFAAHDAGAQTLEACMASSITQAREGTLYLMIAGSQWVFTALKPLLNDMSKDLIYLGKAGVASKMKALVNMVMNANTAALAEGLGLGKAIGLDLEILCKVLSQTGANSRVLETDSQDMIKRDHECYFSAAHAAKDSGIALDLAKEHGVKLPIAEATLEQYKKLVKTGKGELDKSVISDLTFPDRTSL